MIRLDSIYDARGDIRRDVDIGRLLWDMLKERDPIANISHRGMPTMSEHIEFIAERPYKEWWLIGKENPTYFAIVGQAYLTKRHEIGIQIAREFQGRGHAKAALGWIVDHYAGERLLANIAPFNVASQKLFAGFGFDLIQNTYERRTNG